MQGNESRDPTQGVDSMAKLLRRNLSFGRVAGQIKRLYALVKIKGWEAARREMKLRVALAKHGDVWRYYSWLLPLKKTLRAQRKTQLSPSPTISVVVPLYNTPLLFLREMLQSVQNQTYPHWQLVLADASGPDFAEVGRYAKLQAARDGRIHYHKLDGNKGIAANTNAGLALAAGEYIGLLDHDDALQPHALFEVAKAIGETGADLYFSDEMVLDATLTHAQEFLVKGCYAPDTLRGCNYMTHFCVFSRALLQKTGGERSDFDGAQDYDFILRMTEHAEKIHHIPKVLYLWRGHEASTASGIGAKTYAVEAGARALNAHLERVGLVGKAEPQPQNPGAYRIRYNLARLPLVSVIIPNYNHAEDLARCLSSLYAKKGAAPIEVLVVENNSTEPSIEAFYKEAPKLYSGLSVLRYKGGFNFSAICNFGAKAAKGEHLLLLNNDIEIIGDGFVDELLCYSRRPDVGAVGAMLYYPDDTVQHAGLYIGLGGTAGVNQKGRERGNAGHLYRLATTQNMCAVTGAALMVKRALYEELGGLDEDNFAVAFNDVDFCLRLREKGLWNVFTPFATAYHFESKSRGLDEQGAAKIRFDREAAAFKAKYAKLLTEGDPFYSPHLTLEAENFTFKL